MAQVIRVPRRSGCSCPGRCREPAQAACSDPSGDLPTAGTGRTSAGSPATRCASLVEKARSSRPPPLHAVGKPPDDHGCANDDAWVAIQRETREATPYDRGHLIAIELRAMPLHLPPAREVAAGAIGTRLALGSPSKHADPPARHGRPERTHQRRTRTPARRRPRPPSLAFG